VGRWRWTVVIVSFAAMLAVSGYLLWSQWARGVDLPSIPLWTHGLAFGIVLLEIGFRALKIQLSGRALAIPLTFWTALRVCLGGDFAAAVTPGRSGGEPARFLVLAETKLPTASILVVLFLELLLELGSLVLLAGGLWLLFSGTSTTLGLLIGVIGGYATFVLGLGAAGYVLSLRNASGPTPRWARRFGLHAGHWRRIQQGLRHLRGGVGALQAARPGLMTASFAASVAHIVARLAVLPALVWSIDRSVDLAPLVLWPLILLYGSALAPAPGGGGAVEFSFSKALDGTLDPALLATTLIWWRFYLYYLYIVLGALGAGSTVARVLRGERADPGPEAGGAAVADGSAAAEAAGGR
jgi:glycosyltransferase 2 family protein